MPSASTSSSNAAARARFAQRAVGGDDDVVERHRAEATCLVDRRRRFDANARRRCVDRERGNDTFVVTRRDDEYVGDLGVEHEACGAVEAHRRAVGSPARRGPGEIVRTVAARQRDGAQRLTRGQGCEQRPGELGVVGSRQCTAREHRTGQEG
jgi:hypothetical protein